MADLSLEHIMFDVVKSVAADGGGPRVGHLAIPKRESIDTPNFFGLASRGVMPHMTPDVVAKHTELNGSYMALEDFVEKSQKRLEPAVFNIEPDGKETLHAYTATPAPVATVLGARRHPAVIAPMGNGKDYVSIYTSTGFQQLKNKAYYRAVDILQPDIAIPLADLTFGNSHIRTKLPAPKRQLRMVERTEDWLAEFIKLRNSEGDSETEKSAVFASLLPVSYPTQWEYINRLSQDYVQHISGLAVYDADILPDLADHDSLHPLPRLSMDFITSPHEILRQVRLGLDMFTVPFLNTISDAGIALTFLFPPPSSTSGPHPLGMDMWSFDHQVSVKPLVDGCECYTCTKHHRAYLQHLLNAKEMLGWTLLQIHNYHILDKFFEGIRSTISTEPSTFERDCELFFETYEAELPKGTGERPRARGYHFKTEGGKPKINRPAWEKYGEGETEDKALAGEIAGLAVTGATAEGVETPVIPDANTDAKDLDKKGFAEIDE
ncbi:tRNA-guanine transglycosylase [Hypoxylon trugodes]|uniref:tRNA-guanine transglycosylase n=1 Tax=Hypoxylon trugodes TaxID=326681 RepID=UPI0021940540|nr:tRNA-guanine transglycosylase [Hypoxylon trugodes]KAI1391597.1 tRNA-guanine transglycosylase [Hypoxylon trugodes]